MIVACSAWMYGGRLRADLGPSPSPRPLSSRVGEG